MNTISIGHTKWILSDMVKDTCWYYNWNGWDSYIEPGMFNIINNADSTGTTGPCVVHLLTQAYLLPYSTAAQVFVHLMQPVGRFQLALDALLHRRSFINGF
ncbi:hypothetical protein JOM56_012463 [Amanita muscaria]